jgi:hypothetical protein
MIRLTAFLLFLFSLPLLADTQVTHTFEDGEVISAEEFNKNFDDLEAAIDAVGGGEGGPPDGASYGSPVWVDSNGTVLTGRDGRDVIWRVNGELRDIGEVWDDIFVRRVQTYYYASNCSGDIAGYQADSGGDLWITNGVLHEEGALLQNSPLYNSVSRPPQGCFNELGDTEGQVHQESSIGVAAPSWATEGAQMLEDLR